MSPGTVSLPPTTSSPKSRSSVTTIRRSAVAIAAISRSSGDPG